jgi:hypothetical protein
MDEDVSRIDGQKRCGLRAVWAVDIDTPACLKLEIGTIGPGHLFVALTETFISKSPRCHVQDT